MFLVESSPALRAIQESKCQAYVSKSKLDYAGRRTMIDECSLLSMFCPINILCCCPYYVPLHLLFGPWDISHVILLTTIRDLISLYVYMLCRVGIPNCSSPAICSVWHHRTNTNTPHDRPKIGLGYCVSQQQPAVVQSKKMVADRDEILLQLCPTALIILPNLLGLQIVFFCLTLHPSAHQQTGTLQSGN